ncbi:MAG: guanylate kinase [Lentisphaerae bacterium]|nr:guanylate kinase [Lentisphaerota bacterium]
MQIKRLGSAIIVSGPSGVGKSTVCGKVRSRMPELKFSISCTTRQPREGEVDGVHYYFISKDEFEKRIANNEFIEYARVFDNIYGTLAGEVIGRVKAGEDVFLDIDVQGALQIQAAAEQNELLKKVCEFVMLAPPSLEILEQRLRSRASDSAEQIEMRLAKARSELSFYKKYNYVVINDDLETAAADVESIIRSQRSRTDHLPEDFLQ